MLNKKLLRNIPMKRLKPVDGMAVTAQLWEESHEYHRQRQRYHDLMQHSPGIVTGLEVIASDPADSTIYVLPGMAIDPQGELIVIQDPVAYDFGATQGLVYLVLSYAESRPEQEINGGPLYIHTQFGLEAVTKPPEGPFLELARVRRTRGGAIADPAEAEFPIENEIDQRFRMGKDAAGAHSDEVTSLAVCYAGQSEEATDGHGGASLARTLRRAGQRVIVDDGVAIAGGLERYTLVYLVGHNEAALNRDQMNALYAYIKAGGTMLMESCRRDRPSGALQGDGVFSELATSFGITLEEPLATHPLLAGPNLFAVPPAGFETEGTPKLLAGGGLLWSTHDYGCLWQGQRRGRPATREEIRSAMEWGENLIAFALRRKQEVAAQ